MIYSCGFQILYLRPVYSYVELFVEVHSSFGYDMPLVHMYALINGKDFVPLM